MFDRSEKCSQNTTYQCQILNKKTKSSFSTKAEKIVSEICVGKNDVQGECNCECGICLMLSDYIKQKNMTHINVGDKNNQPPSILKIYSCVLKSTYVI